MGQSIKIESLERHESIDELMKERQALERQILSIPDKILAIQQKIDELVRPSLMPMPGFGRTLSKRESTALTFIRSGLSNKEIAHYMGVTINTVKHYVSSILHKTGKTKRGDL